jgi:3'(2'), 5'-bisphosphate nucleotidase
MAYDHELQVALEAVASASEVILERYADFEVIPDAPASITTETDRQSQEIILGFIHDAFPGDALRAEEKTATLAAAPETGRRLWLIDPVDGTRGFARKNGEFSVMVGFVEGGRVGVGVVAEPARGRLTYAVLGGGCWRRDTADTAPQPCRVTGLSELAQATLTQSHSRNPHQPSRQLKALNPARVVETYSAGIKLALVARAEADLYLNTYDACHDWDICAGQILVEEAGGRVTSLSGDSPCYELPGAAHQSGILATNGRLHEPALAALRRASAC